MNIESDHEVQIVRVSSEHVYHLDEEALASLLLRNDVADCPVALVSVAGAFRLGKSFILDFFLRYLYAEPTKQEDGTWLGSEDQPLLGFNWRGGSDRNTTGILLWSRPVRINLPSGEPVAVLLMDTQGTFDSESTTRDSSTIFALSTLLSSVQIYNLSQNIKEDDLQHLQQFTEYGRQAMKNNSDDKPFQVLQFLIRDWRSIREHPYGATGGKQLLNKRLQIEAKQATELQELRKYIRGCFQSLDCYLMPNPGLTEDDPEFDGRLSDIRDEFKKHLLTLVPLILGSRNLPKLINGAPVKGRDLFQYFQTYVKTFNGNELPPPQTIMQANAQATVLCAVHDARDLFKVAMDRVCGAGQPCVSAPALRRHHAQARDAALEAFSRRRGMGDQRVIQTRAEQLAEEFNNQLSQYDVINKAKYETLFKDAKQKYEKCIQNVATTEQLAMHPTDLEKIHENALKDALELFNSKRIVSEEDNDEDLTLLCEEFNERFRQLRILNESNNKTAVSRSLDSYQSRMDSECGDLPCMNPRVLQQKHKEARARALDMFRPNDCREDIYMSQLTEAIDKQFKRLFTLNENNNRTAMLPALSNYSHSMESVCGSHLPCLHPIDLEQKHADARERTLNEFRSERRPRGIDDETGDEYIEKINRALSRRYQTFYLANELNNRMTVTASAEDYISVMDEACGVGKYQISSSKVKVAHENAAIRAQQFFEKQRRPGGQHSHDLHKDKLIRNLKVQYRHYRKVNANNPKGSKTATVIGSVIALGAMAAAPFTEVKTMDLLPVGAAICNDFGYKEGYSQYLTNPEIVGYGDNDNEEDDDIEGDEELPSLPYVGFHSFS